MSHRKYKIIVLIGTISLLLVTFFFSSQISFLSTSSAAEAQLADSDGDGVSNEIDQCPETPGDGEFGCPVEPVDSDGDGVNDANDVCPDTPGEGEFGCPDADGDGLTTRQDACPTQPGPRENAGCPVEEPADPATDTPQPQPLPILPETGECVLATDGRFEVSVRVEPSEESDVVDILEPTRIYEAGAISEDNDWYFIDRLEGWVAASVIRTGGDCQFAEATEEPAQQPGLLDCPEAGDVNALPVYVQNALADNANPCEDAEDILQESVFGQPGIRHLPDETGNRMETNCPALLDDANLRLARLRQYDATLYEQTVERISSAANPCEATRNVPDAPEIGAAWCMPQFADAQITRLSSRVQGYIDTFGGNVSGCADIYPVQELGDLTPGQREFADELVPACDIQSYSRVLNLVSTAMSVNADFEDVLGDNRICIGLDPGQVILDYQQPAPPAAAPSLPPEFIGCPMLGKQIRNHNADLTPVALLSILQSRNPCDAGREYIVTGRIPTLPENIGDSLNECLPQNQREQIGDLLAPVTGQKLANSAIPIPFSNQDVLSMENLSRDAASPANWLADAATPWDVKLAMMPIGSDNPCDTSVAAPQPAEDVCANFVTKQYQNPLENPVSVEARLVYYGIDSSGDRQIAGAASQWTSIVLPPTGSGGVTFGAQTPDRRPQYDFMVQTRVLTLNGESVLPGSYTTEGSHQIIIGRSTQCAGNLPEPDTDLAETGQICARYQGHFGNYGELTAPARVTLGYEGDPRSIHIHETPIQQVYIPANGYGATMSFTVQIADRPNRSVQSFYHMYPGDSVQNISENIQTVPMSNCESDFAPLPNEGVPAATEAATEEVTPAGTPTPTSAPMQVMSAQQQEFCLFFTDLRVNYVEEDAGTQTFRVRVLYRNNLRYEISDDITHSAGFNPAAGASFLIPAYSVTVLAQNKNAIFSNLDYKYRLHIERDSIFKGNDTIKGQVLNIATSRPLALTRTGGEIRVFNRNDENAPDGCEWQTPATNEPDDNDRDQGILDCGRSEPFGLLDEFNDVHDYSYRASAGDELSITLRTETTSPIIPGLTGLNLIGPDDNNLVERTLDNRTDQNQSRSLQYTAQTDGWYTIRIQALGEFVSFTPPEANTRWNYIFTFDCEREALQGQSGTLSNVGGVYGLPQLDVSGISDLQNQLDDIGGIRTRCVAFYSEVTNNSQSDSQAEVQLLAEDASGNTTIASQTYSRTIPAGETRSLNFEQLVTTFSGEQLSAAFSGQGIRYNQWTLTFQGSGSDCSDNQLPRQTGQPVQPPTATFTPAPPTATFTPAPPTSTRQPAGGGSPAAQGNLSNQAIPSSSESAPPAGQQIAQPRRNIQRTHTDIDFFSGNLAAVGTDADGVLYGISNGIATPLFDRQPHDRIIAPALSPNGSQVAYIGIDDDTRQLYVMNIERDIEVTIDTGDHTPIDDQPVWSADNERLLMTLETAAGQTNIYELRVNESTDMTEPLIENAAQPAIAPDDSYLLFVRDGDIFSRSTDSGQIVRVTDNDMRCVSPIVDSNNITAYLVCDGMLYRYDVSGLQALDVSQAITGLRIGSETGRMALYGLYGEASSITLYDAQQSQIYMPGLDVVLTDIDWR